MESTSAPPPRSVLFARGVIARLQLWPAMRAAVDNNWGGPHAVQKRTWLTGELVDAFESTTPAPDEDWVVDMLLQVMEDEFECVLGDDSEVDVARDIVRLWVETGEGNAGSVEGFEARADKLKGKKVQIEVQNTIVEEEGDEEDWEDDDEEGMDVDGEEAPQLVPLPEKQREEPEVDADGFTMVKGKGKR